jgi:hypothetical protein
MKRIQLLRLFLAVLARLAIRLQEQLALKEIRQPLPLDREQ